MTDRGGEGDGRGAPKVRGFVAPGLVPGLGGRVDPELRQVRRWRDGPGGTCAPIGAGELLVVPVPGTSPGATDRRPYLLDKCPIPTRIQHIVWDSLA